MTNAEIQLAITSAGEGAKAYRLVQERAGTLHFVPSLDKPPLSLSPFEQAVVPPGPYGVAYVDAGGKEFVRARPINVVVESLFPVVRESALAPIEKEAAAVGPSLEAEQLSADTLGGRGIAQAFHENLASYVAFQRALGTHSAAGLRIENERIEQIAKASRTMLDAQGRHVGEEYAASREEQDAADAATTAQLGRNHRRRRSGAGSYVHGDDCRHHEDS